MKRRLLKSGLNCDICLKGLSFKDYTAFVKLHGKIGTYWVIFFNENQFVSNGCPPTNCLSKYNIKTFGKSLFSEKKIQEREDYCADVYC